MKVILDFEDGASVSVDPSKLQLQTLQDGSTGLCYPLQGQLNVALKFPVALASQSELQAREANKTPVDASDPDPKAE